nr:MAG TPA: hypothetical protein [Caudoviricetes sp.]
MAPPAAQETLRHVKPLRRFAPPPLWLRRPLVQAEELEILPPTIPLSTL